MPAGGAPARHEEGREEGRSEGPSEGPGGGQKARPDPVRVWGAAAAAAGPSLLAFNLPPSPTFLNQALALALWGVFVGVAGGRWRAAGPAWPLWAALGGVALGVGLSWGPGDLPAGLALSALGLLAAAAALAASGAAVRAAPLGRAVLVAFCVGWLAAGVLNAGIALLQVFAPALPDGDWLARSGLPGRAVGNLRQPNHLSSLLLWAAIALVVLLELGWLRLRPAVALMALLLLAVVLTASRTGLVSVLLLAAWGALDRQRSCAARGLLLAAPLLYALAWGGMWLWAQAGAHAFGGEARLAAGDISSSRFGIWANTLALIRQQPWAGVGFGEFNLAWTLTPFPGRPTAFFDHAHNLPLHLAAELGLPLAGVVLALLGWALWRAARAGAADAGVRGAGLFVLMIGVHSLLEYPLWYAYFLLPTAWAWGYALGRPAALAGRTDAAAARGERWPRRAGALLVLGAAVAAWDYSRVERIFESATQAAPLAQRVADGRRSWFFAHHADYAAATTGLPQPDGIEVFRRPLHYLLDTRLMVAWAQALHAHGDTEAARQVAARLREFGPARAPAFFAGCGAVPAAAGGVTQAAPPASAGPAEAAPAWPCEPPAQAWDWRALQRR